MLRWDSPWTRPGMRSPHGGPLRSATCEVADAPDHAFARLELHRPRSPAAERPHLDHTVAHPCDGIAPPAGRRGGTLGKKRILAVPGHDAQGIDAAFRRSRECRIAEEHHEGRADTPALGRRKLPGTRSRRQPELPTLPAAPHAAGSRAR